MTQGSPDGSSREQGTSARGRIQTSGLDPRLAVAIFVVGLAAIIAVGTWKTPVNPQPSNPVAVATATPAPTPAQSLDEPSASSPSAVAPDPQLVWADLGTPDVFESAVVELLVAGPDELIAFGRDVHNLDPIVWTSNDAIQWQRIPVPSWTFGGGVPTSAAFAGSQVIALGWRATGAGTSREIWTSDDGGQTWARDGWASGRVGSADSAILGLAGSGGITILAGSVAGRALLKRSTDGQRFVDISEGPYAGEGEMHVLASDTGFVGVRSTPDDPAGSTIWTSTDGEDWRQLAVAPIADDIGSTAFGPDVLLVGTDANNSAVTWSTAGVDQALSGLADVGGQEALVGLGSAAVAIGNVGAQGAKSTAIRASSDLRRWVDQEPGIALPVDDWSHLATRYAGALVAIGHEADGRYHVIRAEAVSDRTKPSALPPESLGPTEPTTQPEPGGGPPPTPSPAAGLQWQRVDASGVFGSGGPSFVRRLGDRTVAIAFTADASGHGSWTTTDGLHWIGPAAIDHPGDSIVAVAASDRTLVVAGARASPDGDLPQTWSTTDGMHWVAGVVPGTGQIDAIASGASGFVAVGTDGGGPAIWTSKDGQRWTRVHLDTGTDVLEPGELVAVAGGPSGYAALIGADSGPIAWLSDDGTDWRSAPSVGATEEMLSFGGLVPLGAGFFGVVGSELGPTGVATGTPTIIEGSATQAFAAGPILASSSIARGEDVIESVDGGIAVAGSDGPDPALWYSADGRSWSQIDPLDLAGTGTAPGAHARIADVAADADGLIAVGEVGGRATIWLARPQSALVPDRVCPQAATTIGVIVSMTPAQTATCLGARTVTVRAWATVTDCFGQGGLAQSQLLMATPAECGLNLWASPRRVGGLGPDGDFQLRGLGSGHWVLAGLRFGQADASCQPHVDPNAVLEDAVNEFEPLAQRRFACLEDPHLVSIKLSN